MQNSTVLTALQIIQIIISLALIIVVILQARGQSMGSLFGGGDVGMGITKTRRGLEKTLFQITIILSAMFLVNSVIQLIVQH